MQNVQVLETNNGGGVEDEEDGALFYSDLMPMMVQFLLNHISAC